MASVSTAPTRAGVGADYSGEGGLGMGLDGASRHGNASMHPAPDLFEAPPTGTPRPEDPRRDRHGIRSSSSSGHSAGRGSMTTSVFEGYTLDQGLGRRSLSQRSPTSPPTQHETTPSTNPASIANLTRGETPSAPYSNVSSPIAGPSHVVFPMNEASERGASRKASRRRTGPLSAESRERAGVIRKVGACPDCRRRRVACDPSHRGLSWDEARKKTGSGAEGLRELAPVSPRRPGFRPVNASYNDAHDRMELDPSPISPESDHQSSRTRKPLPTAPRLEKQPQAALSLPPVDQPSLHGQGAHEVTVTFPTIHARYDKVEALLLLWDDEHLEAVEKIVEELRTLWEERYHFTCHVYRIPPSSGNGSAWKSVSEAMRRFIDGCDFRGALSIVYYNGQARLNHNREMVLVNSPQSGEVSEIRWPSMQTFLTEMTADTLVLMDCPYFGSNETKTHGILEILAAGSVGDFVSGPLSRCVFTRALIDHLRRRAGQLFREPFTVAELHTGLCVDYARIYQDWNHDQRFLTKFPGPLYLQVAGSPLLPSVLLAPLRPRPASHASSSGNATMTSPPQDELTLKITGVGLNVESLRELARVISMSAQSVSMQATFHNAS